MNAEPSWLENDGPDQYRIAKIDRYEAEGGPSPRPKRELGRRYRSEAQMESDYLDTIAEEKCLARREAELSRPAKTEHRCDVCGGPVAIAGWCMRCEDDGRGL